MAAHQPDGLQEVGAALVVARDRARRPAHQHRGTEAGDGEHDRGGEDQVRRAELGGDDTRQARARHRSQQGAGADDLVQALGLGDGVQLAQHHPELQRGQRPQQSRPDVERPQRPGMGRGAGEPEQQGHRRASHEEHGQRPPAVQLLRDTPGALGKGDGDGRHGQVDPRQLRGRKPREEQRVTRRLEERVAGQDPEQREEGADGPSTLAGTYVGDGGEHAIGEYTRI
jgi:hypothetical protein